MKINITGDVFKHSQHPYRYSIKGILDSILSESLRGVISAPLEMGLWQFYWALF